MSLYVCVSAQSRPTLCDPMNCSPPDSSVRGILQARILEWVAISSSRGSSWPRDWTCVFCIGRQNLYHWATWETACLCIFNAFTSLFCPELLLRKCCVSADKEKPLWDILRITDPAAFSLSVMKILSSKSKLPTGHTVEPCWSRMVTDKLPRRWRQDKKWVAFQYRLGTDKQLYLISSHYSKANVLNERHIFPPVPSVDVLSFYSSGCSQNLPANLCHQRMSRTINQAPNRIQHSISLKLLCLLLGDG